MDEVQTFGEWIKQRRKTFDLTQEELARRVGCATSTLKKIEQEEPVSRAEEPTMMQEQ